MQRVDPSWSHWMAPSTLVRHQNTSASMVRPSAVQLTDSWVWLQQLGPTETSMKAGPRQWPAVLPFLAVLLTFAAGEVDQDLRADCPTCEGTSLLQTPKASHIQKQASLSDAKESCLSFIHIPKTGGQSMETARLNSAGIQAPEGCSAKTFCGWEHAGPARPWG